MLDWNRVLEALKNEVPPEELERFLVEHNICPECCTGRYVEEKNGEVVCLKCGLVLSETFDFEEKVPINEVRSPTCSLSYRQSLGSHLSERALFKVLALNGSDDLPVRVTQARILQRVEFPQLQRALEYGSKLTREFLGSPRNKSDPSDPVIVFAEALGRNIRHVIAESLQRSRGSIMVKRLVNAVFLYTYKKHFGMNGLFRVYDKLGLDREAWDYVCYLLEAVPKLPTKIEYLRR